MLFKTNKEEEEFQKAPECLKLVMDYFIQLSLGMGVEPVVTRIMEPVAGESGVHQDYRAGDFRNEMGVGGKRLYNDTQAAEIVLKMNTRFPRKDGKLVCIHHSFVNHEDPDSTRMPYHFHVQIPWQAKLAIPEEWKA